ncbi:MAG TPA: hypothetical protein DCZ43_03470, partial [candidate division Zixibacteria bacterium]|nr:hypothetical protein [candidate division Zixibacteria bacterium]
FLRFWIERWLEVANRGITSGSPELHLPDFSQKIRIYQVTGYGHGNPKNDAGSRFWKQLTKMEPYKMQIFLD